MIKILRKTGHGISWVRNALFYMEFPINQIEFIIPSLSWMIYLYHDFELIEAVDDKTGKQMDLRDIRTCCSESINLQEIKVLEQPKIIINNINNIKISGE